MGRVGSVPPACRGNLKEGVFSCARFHKLCPRSWYEFALALDEACFAREGVGVVFKDLLERILDLRCKVGSVAHSAWSVPYSGGVLKLMSVGRTAVRPYTPLPLRGERGRGQGQPRNHAARGNSTTSPKLCAGDEPFSPNLNRCTCAIKPRTDSPICAISAFNC